MKTITLVPAYGRDYKSAKAVREDYEADKDFVIADYFNPWDGRYANRPQLGEYGEVRVRYDGLRKVVVIEQEA